jgi:hypothetical protein
VRTCFTFSAKRSYRFFFTKSRACGVTWAYVTKGLTLNTEYCCIDVEQFPLRSERCGKPRRFFTVFNIYELGCDVRLGCILPEGVLRGVCSTDYLRVLEVLHADARRRDQHDRSKEVVQSSFHGLHRESSPKVARNSDRGDYM